MKKKTTKTNKQTHKQTKKQNQMGRHHDGISPCKVCSSIKLVYQ